VRFYHYRLREEDKEKAFLEVLEHKPLFLLIAASSLCYGSLFEKPVFPLIISNTATIFQYCFTVFGYVFFCYLGTLNTSRKVT
jgi:hypothetical protein